MKNNFSNLLFLFFLISFFFIQRYLSPRPRKEELFSTELIKNFKLVKKNINYEIKDDFIKHNISIGNTFYIVDPFLELEITPIYSWKKEFLDMRMLSKKIPSLIIKSNKNIYRGDNNYGSNNIDNNILTQACFFGHNKFFYKPVFEEKKIKFNDLRAWNQIIKDSFFSNIKFKNNKIYSCILITVKGENFLEKIDKIDNQIFYNENNTK